MSLSTTKIHFIHTVTALYRKFDYAKSRSELSACISDCEILTDRFDLFAEAVSWFMQHNEAGASSSI